jgi:hypothetical protein
MVGYPFVDFQMWKGMGAIAILLSMLTFFAGHEALRVHNASLTKEGLYHRDSAISSRSFEAEHGLYQVDKVSEEES